MSSESPAPPEEPKSLFEKIGAALPVALTAIATAFAGLSTSELSYAMYWRSAAAQDQAKANDQWSLAGFKRDRSLIVQTAAAQLRAAAGYRPMPPMPPASAGDDTAKTAAEWLAGKGPPRSELPKVEDEAVRAVLEGVRERKPEADVVRLARAVKREKIDEVIAAAEGELARLDKEWDPVLKHLDAAAQQATERAVGDDRAKAGDASLVQAARYDVDYRRYRAEATLNQQVGFLYEARVKTSTATSDRHRGKSMNFFYAMLAAQVGATVASLSLARKQKSALWAVAGAAGVVAVVFGVYVYLGM